MIIDAHHHLWTADYAWLGEPELAPIRRDFTVDDLRQRIAAASVAGTVLVEAGARDLAETRRFLVTADATPEILGVVGWVSFTDADLARTVADLRAGRGGGWLVGVRDQVQAVTEPGHLARPEVRRCLATAGELGLAVDLVVRDHQLPDCAELAAATPQTTFVLDHLGKPRFDHLDEWRDAVGALAARPNTVAKLSGLLTEAGPEWTLATIAPVVRAAADLFGPDRLMFGSDWPVCELVASYDQALAAIQDCLPGLSPAERDAVFAHTALRTYGLAVTR